MPNSPVAVHAQPRYTFGVTCTIGYVDGNRLFISSRLIFLMHQNFYLARSAAVVSTGEMRFVDIFGSRNHRCGFQPALTARQTSGKSNFYFASLNLACLKYVLVGISGFHQLSCLLSSV